MSETPTEGAAPELTPEEQAVSQAHTDVNDAEQGWSGKVEARLAAIEEHLGIGDSAQATDETAPAAEEETK